MRDKHYPIKQFRISEELFDELKKLKEKEKLSWNLLFKKLVERNQET